MRDEDDLCLCFHVPAGKIKQFIRIEKPKRASQLSECYGAGTGCGWCRPFLERMMNQEGHAIEEWTPEQYAKMRHQFREKG